MFGSLSEKEIEAALAALNDGAVSEDDENLDDDNIDYYPNVRDLLHDLDEKSIDHNLPLEHNEDPPIVYEEEHILDGVSMVEPVAGTSSAQSSSGITGIVAWRSRSREMIWKKRNLPWDEDRIAFLGDSELPTEISDLEEPFQFFTKFIKPIITKGPQRL